MVKLNKKLIVQKMEKETVIFDGSKSVLYTLNETAAYIFGKLKAGWPENKIADSLCKAYKVEKTQAVKDITELVSGLKKKKILL